MSRRATMSRLATRGAPFLVALTLTILRPPPGSAQAVAGFPVDDSRSSILLEASLEPELVVSIGYLYRVTSAPSSSSLHVGAGLEMPPYLIENGSLRANLMAKGRWVADNDWGASVTSMAYYARNDNRTGTMNGLGLEVRAQPGYHGSRWAVAADIGWQTTVLAHIEHSDLVGETFEDRYLDGTSPADAPDGPRDGWYGATAGRIRLGVSGGRVISEDLSFRIAAGSLFSLQRQGLFLSFAHAQVPVYLETSVKGIW